MKRQIYILFLLVLLSISCANRVKYKALLIEIYPSWLTHSSNRIDLKNGDYSIKINKGILSFENSNSNWTDSEIFIKGRYNEQEKIALRQFIDYKVLPANRKSPIGKDGIRINLSLITNSNDTIFMDIWSPSNGSIDKDFMNLLLKPFNSSNDKRIIEYYNAINKK